MITAQRDRFKKKNATLESELQKSYQSIQSLRSEVAALQKDNLSLYEKTRYVSTYNRTATIANPTTIQIDGPTSPAADVGTRYRSAYESSLSPFNAFRSRESARAFKRMSVPERAVVQVTRMILATRTSRNLFAIYCFGLHILVVVVLFHMGEHSGSTKKLSSVPMGGATKGGAGPPVGPAVAAPKAP
jgi:homeobox protein cut-like